MNTHPLHFDAEYGRQTEFGKCLVNSTLTLSIVVGMSVNDVSLNAVANLGWDEVRLPHPLFAGDTLYAESEVLGIRESRSRPNAGIVTVRTRGYNQHCDLVIDFKRSALIYRRGAAPDMLAARRSPGSSRQDSPS
jgi:acyl dehydratase